MQMRILMGVALVSGVSAAPLVGRQAPEVAPVVEAVDAFHLALAAGDSAAALALLAPDVVIVESGNVQSLAEYRSGHLRADMAFARAVPRERSDITVRRRGDVAWAWSTATSEGTFRDREVNSRSAELMVLARTATGWQIQAIHWSSRRGGG